MSDDMTNEKKMTNTDKYLKSVGEYYQHARAVIREKKEQVDNEYAGELTPPCKSISELVVDYRKAYNRLQDVIRLSDPQNGVTAAHQYFRKKRDAELALNYAIHDFLAELQAKYREDTQNAKATQGCEAAQTNAGNALNVATTVITPNS